MRYMLALTVAVMLVVGVGVGHASDEDAPTIKWTLPFSCENAKYYHTHFTQTQLNAMRKAAGLAMPTAAQRAQIQACLAGRIK